MLIDLLAEYGIHAWREEGHTGVWTARGKVAAIGVGVHSWTTFHGIALNVAPDLNWFAPIVPCGLEDAGVTSMATVLGAAPDIDEVAVAMRAAFRPILTAAYNTTNHRGATGEMIRLAQAVGADALQLFDSWAGVLPEEQLFSWSLEPMVRIAHGVRARHPKIPIIAFPRAVGPASLMYRRPDAFDVLSIDTGLGAHWAARELQPQICLQGNLDPIMVVAGGKGTLWGPIVGGVIFGFMPEILRTASAASNTPATARSMGVGPQEKISTSASCVASSVASQAVARSVT